MSDEVTRFSEEERDQIRTSLRRMLAERWPPLRALELGCDPEHVRHVWHELEALAVPDLARDPAFGGVREVLLAFEELGRACCSAPLLGRLVANLIFRLGGADINLALEDGQLFAVAFGPFDGDSCAGRIEYADGSVTGSVHFVEGAGIADRHILFVDNPAGVVIVDAKAPGICVEETPALSLPALASIHLSSSPAIFSAVPEDVLQDIVQIARLAAASRAVGAGQRGYELVVEHAGTRKQFGKLIGQFQAVQHRLADNLTRLDAARLTLDAAATGYDHGLESWSTLADLALAHLNPSLRQLAIDMHQLMGAIGYAEEHELPRHFRQIHGNVARFGGAFRARAAVGGYLVGAS